MQYAARVAELIEAVGGEPVEPELVERLALARSNVDDEGDGRRVWQRRVAPARIDPEKVCAHVAVHMLVEPDLRRGSTSTAITSSSSIASSGAPGARG